jgi:MOSC domain-containing protein
MASIRELNVYPVKSCRPITLREATLSATGLAFDRSWMIIDKDAGFVTQREQPRLALVGVALDNGFLRLTAPGMDDLDVPTEARGEAQDCQLFGETCRALGTIPQASGWFSDYLKGDFRLVSFDPSFHRRGGVQYPTRDQAPTTFVDNFGVLVLSQASLDDLNLRLGPHAVPMNRFRPNIVIDGVAPFEEEFAESFTVGDVKLRVAAVCTRCTMTNIDQSSAKVGEQPFTELSSYRYDEGWKGTRFGAYAAVVSGIGRSVRVGDSIDLNMSF